MTAATAIMTSIMSTQKELYSWLLSDDSYKVSLKLKE